MRSAKACPGEFRNLRTTKLDEAGNYQYRAFGLPRLALMKSEEIWLVISPYSTFLALTVDSCAGAAQSASHGSSGMVRAIRIL